MIDPSDQLTQALPLDEQPTKRKRGRPATGNAMTPAEKQRAYRERQKQKAAPELGLKGALENWETACRNLGAANDRVKALEDQMQRLQAVRDELINELRATKKELKSRYEKPSKGLSYRKLTDAAFDQVKTNEKAKDVKAARDWSFGTYLLWDYLAPLMNVQEAQYQADMEKLRKMVGLGPKAQE